MTRNVEYINPPGACPAQGLYSHVGKAAGSELLFIAGQLSVATDGSVAGKGDFAAQFRQVFSNMGDVLKGLGCDFNDVVKFTTFLRSSVIVIWLKAMSKPFACPVRICAKERFTTITRSSPAR